jgi:hypothetical protein
MKRRACRVRPRWLRPSVWIALWLAASPAGAQDAGVSLPELFVDASAPSGGNGSQAHPFQRLDQALGAGARVRLAPGIYSGGLLLRSVELLGGPSVVITATPPAICLRTQGAVKLRGVQIQGGATGLRVESGQAELQEVHFSGQRGPAVEVLGGAELRLEASALQAGVSQQHGLRLVQGARATVRDVSFEGPFSRAVSATEPAMLRMEKVRVRQAVTAFHLEGGEAWLSTFEAGGGRGPALYVARGRLHLSGVTLVGHEYGLLTGDSAQVDGTDVRSRNAERAGLGIVGSQATLNRLTVEEAGDFGGVQLLGSEVRLTDLSISGGRSSGVVMREGRLEVLRARISGLQSPDPAAGDGVQIRGGEAHLSRLVVERCSGIGLVAAQGAQVTLERSEVRGAGVAGLSAETEAHLRATDVTVEGSSGPAAVVLDGGEAQLRRIRARDNQKGAVWAECSSRATVQVEDWSGDVRPTRSVCVSVTP